MLLRGVKLISEGDTVTEIFLIAISDRKSAWPGAFGDDCAHGNLIAQPA